MTTTSTLRPQLSDLAREYAAGDSLRLIGERRRVSHEAVRQALLRLPNYTQLRAQHDAVLHTRAQRPTPPEVNRERRRREGPLPRGRQYTGLTDEAVIADMRAWARKHGEPVSVSRWNRVADPAFVSAATITKRLGWNDAKQRAGLTTATPKRTYTSRWSDEDLRAAVVQFLNGLHDVADATFDRYDRWSRPDYRRPSAATLRNRLGLWGDIVRQGLADRAKS